MYATGGKGNNRKKEWKVENLVCAAGEEIARNILFIYAWTGCDTTSAIYRHDMNN